MMLHKKIEASFYLISLKYIKMKNKIIIQLSLFVIFQIALTIPLESQSQSKPKQHLYSLRGKSIFY